MCNQPVSTVWEIYYNFAVVVTRPLLKDEGMADDHGAPEVGQLSRAWTRSHRETKAERREESVAGQYRMR